MKRCGLKERGEGPQRGERWAPYMLKPTCVPGGIVTSRGPVGVVIVKWAGAVGALTSLGECTQQEFISRVLGIMEVCSQWWVRCETQCLVHDCLTAYQVWICSCVIWHLAVGESVFELFANPVLELGMRGEVW